MSLSQENGREEKGMNLELKKLDHSPPPPRVEN